MYKIIFLVISFLIFHCGASGQVVKELIVSPPYQIKGIGDISYSSSIGSFFNGLLSLNVQEGSGSKSAFFSYNNTMNFADGTLVGAARGDLEIVKQFHISATEWLFFANITQANVSSMVAQFTYNTAANRISSAVFYAPDTSQFESFEMKDAAVQQRDYYMLGKASVAGSALSYNQIVVIKASLGSISWYKTLGTGDTDLMLEPESIQIMFNGHIMVSGYTVNLSSGHRRSFFCIIDRNGNLLNKYDVYFYDSQKRKERVALWSRVAQNDRRLHLFQQSYDSLSSSVQFLATMIDTNGALLTWRNYDFPVTAEDAVIAQNAFLIGGRSHMAPGLNGYCHIRINALNAIPEGLFNNFIGNFGANFAAKKPSRVFYNLFSNQFESLVFDNSEKGSRVFHFVGDARGKAACVDSFTYIVAKDPLEFKEGAFTWNDFKPWQAVGSLSVDKIILKTVESCISNSENPKLGDAGLIVYPIHRNELSISNAASGHYRILDLKGVVRSEGVLSNSTRVNMPTLLPGVYLFSLSDQGGKLKHCKFSVF